MYQHGWKRKVDYVIAFSNEDIQDVTWRYANNHKETMRNRQRCTESDLLKTIVLLREKRQQNLSAARKYYLKKRNVREIVDLFVQRPPTENELKGRSSGSLSWRQTRGEEQQCSSNNVRICFKKFTIFSKILTFFLCFQFFVFNASETEVSAKQFNLRYSSAKNEYQRYVKHSNGLEMINATKSWQSCAYRWQNISRKEERDWKMVYLARTEDTDEAEIEYKFDFSDLYLKINEISLKFDLKTYESGKINVRFLHKGEPWKHIFFFSIFISRFLFASFQVKCYQISKASKT